MKNQPKYRILNYLRAISEDEEDWEDYYTHEGIVRLKYDNQEVGKLESRLFESSMVGTDGACMMMDDAGVSYLDIWAELEKYKHTHLLDKFDVLILDSLQINDEHRGQGLGLKMIDKHIRYAHRSVLGDELLVCMLPCPIGNEPQKEKQSGKKKLWDYYSRLLPLVRMSKKSDYGFLLSTSSARRGQTLTFSNPLTIEES